MKNSLLRNMFIAVGALVICLLNFGAYKIQLSDRGIVVGVSVDKEDGLFVINEQLVVASSSDKENVSFYLLESRGNTLTEAFNNTEIKSGSVNFYKHCKVVIFGDGLDAEDIKYVTETFYSEIDFPDSVPLVFYEGKASEVLKAEPPEGLASSFHLNKLFGINLSAGVNAVNLKDYVINVSKDGKTGYMPVVSLSDFNALQGEEKKQNDLKIFNVNQTVFFFGREKAYFKQGTKPRFFLLRKQVEIGKSYYTNGAKRNIFQNKKIKSKT